MKKFSDFSNTQLLEAVQQGNGDAFNEAYFRYHQKVFGYALKFVRCREEAEELTQDTFVKLFEIRERIDVSKTFEAFLYTLIRNNFLESLRKKARFSVFQAQALRNETENNPIEHYIDFKDSFRLADAAVNALPLQAKTAYTLSRKDGLSHEDISLKMGISKNTVSNHIKKSLGLIRKHFAIHSPETIFSLLMVVWF